MSDADRFYEGLCKVAYDALSECTVALRNQERENERLRKIIAAFPSTATDLQDRVTLLESRPTNPSDTSATK